MLIVAVLTLLSCSTPEQVQQRKCEKAQKKYELKAFKLGCPWQIYDSVVITKQTTVYRDTTVYVHIPGELVHDSIKVPYIAQFSTPINILTTKYAISKAWIENSLLRHTLTQIQSNVPTTIPGAIQITTATKEKIVKVPYPVERRVQKELNWIQRFGLWSGGVAWLLLILYSLYRFRKAITFPLNFP